MREQESQDEPSYEVGQEQLDAVDRMLEELDLDEEFGRVPAAFRIVERFEQQQRQQQRQQQDFSHSSISSYNENTSNGPGSIRSNNYMDMDTNNDPSDQIESEDDNDDDPAPFGYIPLDQGYSNLDDGEDEDEDDNNQGDAGGYDQMLSDGEADHISKGNNSENSEDDDDDDEGQGYDGYLRSVNRDGTMPMPVIPPPVQIDLEEADERSTEQIPEEDLKTIAMVMNSFSLPAPDWAKSIPEERWLPKIVQQAESSSPSLSSLDKDRPLP
ncbi:hypothetical protein BGZ80_004060 [Entomortierella chlamydospora]|uniref:Male-enhanced antigen 1 n=1 Tax=Entomortierella chlamydospora TaxID=101097 RepID=A0A9P6SW51_9FUNG|nr:hypothetical protein BGZ79_002255 [Entomortierella chlamydospora]KAG0007933.1 hypothetical protein BGZ80_004060 [Entomortierella chlamydospora]